MQQLGGSLGLAVLVTVFASGSKAAAGDLPAGLDRTEAAHRVFVAGVDHAFWTATGFLLATWLVVTFVVRVTRKAEVFTR
jgi:hypothetical protein